MVNFCYLFWIVGVFVSSKIFLICYKGEEYVFDIILDNILISDGMNFFDGGLL